MARIRSFIAIFPPQETQTKIAQTQEKLKTKYSQISWQEPANFHTTLAFLGNVPEEMLGIVKETLAKVTATFQPFDLQLGSVGYFYNRKEDSIIFIDILDREKRLQEFYKTLHHELAFQDFLITKRFVPYIATGRVKRQRFPHDQKNILADIAEEENNNQDKFVIDKVGIYKSFAGRREAADSGHYRLIRDFPLGQK